MPTRNQTFHTIGLALGDVPSPNTSPFQAFSLTPSNPLATLDYGFEVAGYPIFFITSVSGKVQIDVKYSEEFQALNSPLSDGPFAYAISLSNTYRVETFSVSKPGLLELFLIKGGQRWQTIRLLTNGSITFSSVGFKASVPVTDVDKLPRGFDCDDQDLNEIWKLGARATGVSCVEKGSQKRIWEFDDQGNFVRGMRASISAKGAFLENYTLEFDAKIQRAGLSWVVAHPLASPAKGLQLNLVGKLPADTTFVNTNTSLTPPSSILLSYGYSLVNMTTLTSYYLDTFNIPFSVADNTWYRIKTVLSAGEYSTGSFGFGGWQDQAGYFKNVVVYDTVNKSIIYQNTMMDEEQVVAEYGIHEKYASLRDFIHTVRIISASTSQTDIAKSTLKFLLDWQTLSGLLPYAPPIGYSASIASDTFSVGGGGYMAGYEVAAIILPDYQIHSVLSLTDYVALTNDLMFARKTWSAWKLNLGWLLAQVNSTTGLLSVNGAFPGPQTKGSAINCVLVEALKAMADVASALDDSQAEIEYRTTATRLSFAISDKLWNNDLGTYSISTSLRTDYSVAGIAFCSTSGTANITQAKLSLASLSALKLGPRYKDSTKFNSSDPSTNISPNTNGFLLSALLSTQNHADTALSPLKSLWAEILNDNETSTSASWEYVNLYRNPGLGYFTSLSYPWGGAPTYLLTEWVVGIQRGKGVGGFGYGEWIVRPDVGVRMGLKKARGRVETEFGGLEVEWGVMDSMMKVKITASRETKGTFQYDDMRKSLRGAEVYTFEVEIPW